MKLSESFYQQSDVVKIARELLGKELVVNIRNKISGGIIVETEAYSWKEKGSHAYNNRKTDRNAVMYLPGGFSYVYLCYGIHNMFNVVTGADGVAEAVLIRALEPTAGIALMHKRMNTDSDHRITSGPGKLAKALGIDRSLNGKYLLGDEVCIEDSGIKLERKNIIASKRIGIDYAGEDALLPWRFTIKDNKWVSKV